MERFLGLGFGPGLRDSLSAFALQTLSKTLDLFVIAASALLDAKGYRERPPGAARLSRARHA